MAVKVKVGDIFTDIKVGVGAKGAWGLANARAEKGYDRITIWFANPEDIPDGTYAIRVDEIEEVSIVNKLDKQSGKWYTQYHAKAKVSAVEGGAEPTTLDDEGVPF